jgi:hypothetical protein
MTWSMPRVGDASAAVEGEGRTVPSERGPFTDSLADNNSIHIYRIDGGSQLPTAHRDVAPAPGL